MYAEVHTIHKHINKYAHNMKNESYNIKIKTVCIKIISFSAWLNQM